MLKLKQKNVGNDVGDVGKDNNGLGVDFVLNFDDKGEMKMMGGQSQCLVNNGCIMETKYSHFFCFCSYDHIKFPSCSTFLIVIFHFPLMFQHRPFCFDTFPIVVLHFHQCFSSNFVVCTQALMLG
jgi:hypothetical protein